MTLAVVDDDESVRRALGRLLRSLGHDVRVFGSAEEFEAEDATVDCVVLDVRMPGLSGFELLERLRSRPIPTPVVFVTGHTDPNDGDIPPVDTQLLTKPFDEVTLMAAIDHAIASATAAREHDVP